MIGAHSEVRERVLGCLRVAESGGHLPAPRGTLDAKSFYINQLSGGSGLHVAPTP